MIQKIKPALFSSLIYNLKLRVSMTSAVFQFQKMF